jgi:hypothetical protein
MIHTGPDVRSDAFVFVPMHGAMHSAVFLSLTVISSQMNMSMLYGA